MHVHSVMILLALSKCTSRRESRSEKSVLNYRIRSIRRRSYYLFHRAILCSFYSRAATIREWRLLYPKRNGLAWYYWTGRSRPLRGYRRRQRRARGDQTSSRRLLVLCFITGWHCPRGVYIRALTCCSNTTDVLANTHLDHIGTIIMASCIYQT